MAKAKKTTIEIFHDLLLERNWPDLQREGERLFVARPEGPTIIEKKDNRYILNFVWYGLRKNEYGIKTGRLSQLITDYSFDIFSIVYFDGGGYQLSRDGNIKGILQINANGINSDAEILNIAKGHKGITLSSADKTLSVAPKLFLSVLKDADSIARKSSSYGSSVSRYLINLSSNNYLKKGTQHTTSINKGEFAFLVHRLNLETKTNTADFKKYLEDDDIKSLQDLTLKLIKEDVFEPDFLRQLDDYFIREKLRDIVALGREVLALGSSDLSTDKAREIVPKIFDTKKVKQLESLWQRYFEKYLLYLIFSYKEIYPKVKLKLDAEKKFPDFLGINHYNGIDVIEIKTHLTPALTWDASHKNYSFSPDLSRAIIQTMNYTDALKQHRFAKPADKQKITETTEEENLYRPRGIIIISSHNKLIKGGRGDKSRVQRDFTTLRHSLHNIEILTFDEVIGMADTYAKNIMNEV